MAALGALLTFTVIVSSAYLRLVHTGVGCEPWPECYGLVEPQFAQSQPRHDAVRWVRGVHRVAASGAAVLAIAALVLAARSRHRPHV
jgi:cytochrome c oxidase assembly protein subunit 15